MSVSNSVRQGCTSCAQSTTTGANRVESLLQTIFLLQKNQALCLE